MELLISTSGYKIDDALQGVIYIYIERERAKYQEIYDVLKGVFMY